MIGWMKSKTVGGVRDLRHTVKTDWEDERAE